MYTCILTSNIDTWEVPGGQKVGVIRAGLRVTGNAPRPDGWVHLIAPYDCYTKKSMLPGYTLVTNPPPPPPPSPLPDVLYIATEEDLSDARKYVKS